MGPRTTTTRRSRFGDLEVRHQDTDSPILPVGQLERLVVFRPDSVDFVMEQTRVEAEHRRKEESKVNNLVFAERMSGQLFALVVGICGIFGGVRAAALGHEATAIAIATVSVGTLAVVFVTRKTRG